MQAGNEQDLLETAALATEALSTRAPDGVPGDGEHALPAGARLGHYRIVSLLGQGGMGEVYRADQLEPVHRVVALKLLRGHRLDARHLAWFEVERQVLAQMQHPAIAHIYDAGATRQGYPYFAMEYIEGSPITAYCDGRGLDLAGRVELLARVCDGVSHAHGKGVVHRDLKPGNILVSEVDGMAQPKIIDFGIATAASRYTADEEHDRAGTPAYMSPEQAGLAAFQVDTRSDVYSLGVVLFELLTDSRPPAASSSSSPAAPAGSPRPGDATRTTLQPPSAALLAQGSDQLHDIARGRGVSPSRLLRTLRHELDWVVMKAIRHDPAQRYQSAAELAQELRRFLAQEPLLAVPPSRHYVLDKFARRHRLALTAAGAIALALVAGLGLSLWGLMQAQQQRGIAEARQAELERVAAFQQSMLEEIDVAAMGQGLLDLQREQLARGEDGAAAVAAFDAAVAPVSAADVARGVLDRYLLAQSLEAIGEDFDAQPALAADLRLAIARVYFAIGQYPQSEAAARAAALAREQLHGSGDARTLEAYNELGDAMHRQGRLDEARALLEPLLPRARAAGEGAGEVANKLALSLALVYSDQGELERAEELQRQLLEYMLPVHGERHEQVLSVRTNLAITLVRRGEREQAREHFEEIYGWRVETLGLEHPDTRKSMSNAAAIRGMTGDFAGALELQRQSLEINERTLGAEHPATLNDYNNIGSLLSDMGDAEEAAKMFDHAARVRTRVLGPEHPATLSALQNQVAMLNRVQRPAEALPLQQQVLAARERTLGAEHPDTLKSRDTHAHVLRDLGQLEAARTLAQDNLDTRRRVLGDAHPDTAASVILLASVEARAGSVQRARAMLEQLVQQQRDALGPGHAHTLVAAARLYPLLLKDDDAAAARALRAGLFDPLLARDAATLDGATLRARQDVLEALEPPESPEPMERLEP